MSEPTQTPRTTFEDWWRWFTKDGSEPSYIYRVPCGAAFKAGESAALERLDEIAAEERSCCPDGVGFREYIGRLKARLASSNEIIAAYPEGAIETLKKWHEMKCHADKLTARIKVLETALTNVMPFILEDEDLAISQSYRRAIVDAKKALSPQEGLPSVD